MEPLTIYHNGSCSKCKGALELLLEKGVPHNVRWYMADPLSEDEINTLLDKLHLPVTDLVRTSEPLYTEQYEGKDLGHHEWVKILAENPVLMQRPIVVKGDKAIIARPAERVLQML